MKKIIVIIIIFLLLPVTIKSQENSLFDINKNLNEQTNKIYEDYGIIIKVDIVDFSDNPQVDAIKSFVSKYNLHKKGNKFWNILIFYSKEQNDLRLVSFRRCSLGKDTLKAIKDSDLVKTVLSKESPSEEEVYNMLSYVIGEIRHVIYEIKPRKDLCLTGDYVDILRNDEYVVPDEVVAIVISSAKGTDPLGMVLPSAFYVLKGILYEKSIFNEKLSNLSYDKQQIDEYLEELTTKGNIIILKKTGINNQELTDVLMHERFHKEWYETLTENELSILYEAYRDIIQYRKEYENGFSISNYKFFIKKSDYGYLSDDGYRLSAQLQCEKYYAEFYAHLATGSLIDPIEEIIKKEYPKAYAIFEEVRERVK